MNGSDRKPHIAFLITSLRFGGAERVVSNLSRYFSEAGSYRVSLLLLENKIDLPVSDKVSVVPFRHEQQGIIDRIISVITDPLKLSRYVKQNSVDIVLSFMQRPNAINLLAKAFGSGHKACVSIRCRLKVHYEKELNVLSRMIGYGLFRWLWHYADVTIVNSNDIKSDVEGLFNVEPSRVVVIYNPLDLEEIERKKKEDVAEEWFRKKDAPIIINVASLTGPKGHSYLLKAFARVASHRPARLVLVGDGELRPELVKEAERLNIAEKVLFLGWQDNPYKYMASSSVFVLSSIYEGCPNALLEAMACGLPVISFDCPSGPAEILCCDAGAKGDIIKARYGVLVSPGDETALALAIEGVLSDSGMMSAFSRAALGRSRQFDLPGIAKQYEKALIA